MKIILLANKEQKEELLAQHEIDAELIWGDEPGSLKDIDNADACIDLLFDDSTEKITNLKNLKTAVTIVNSVTRSSNELSDCVRVNGWNTFLKRPLIEAAGPANLQKKTEEIFSLFNKKIEWVPDITGLVSARVVASIINEAFFALDEKVSTKEEIDTAMKLGTNYPYGPFEWAQRIGIENIYNLLKQLSKEQKRYEPSALLKKEATS